MSRWVAHYCRIHCCPLPNWSAVAAGASSLQGDGTGTERQRDKSRFSVSPCCLQNNNRRGSDALVLELVLVLLPPSRLLSLSTRLAIVRVSVGSVLETGDCGLEQREREYWKER